MTSPSFPSALLNGKELQLTTVGRKTGRESTRPVWFIHRGETLYLWPGYGRESQWYRNVLRTPTIRLSAGAVTRSARATPITNPMDVEAVVDAFRDKYGAGDIARLYPKHEVAVEVHALA
jgi:deazaflavin-dependent oxidoreductase (nitroreductase family)